MHNEISDYLRMIDDADNAHSPTSRAAYADALILAIRDYFTDDELIELVQAKAEGRLVVLPCKGEELREKYRALTSPTGDGVQTYTTGYRNGHRNGQAELIAYLLQIDLGTREAAEKPLGGGEDGSSKDK